MCKQSVHCQSKQSIFEGFDCWSNGNSHILSHIWGTHWRCNAKPIWSGWVGPCRNKWITVAVRMWIDWNRLNSTISLTGEKDPIPVDSCWIALANHLHFVDMNNQKCYQQINNEFTDKFWSDLANWSRIIRVISSSSCKASN